MSDLRVDTVSDRAGTGPVALTGQVALKAYAHYGNTGSANEAFNISSVTDNGTGDATLNFTNNMSSATYTHFGQPRSEAAQGANFVSVANGNAPTASAIRIGNFAHQSSQLDPVHASEAIVGDLA